MRISVRVARPQDAAAVSAVVHSAYTQLMAGSYDPALLAVAVEAMGKANPALLASGTYYVAEAETGAIIGSGGWTQQRPGTMHIEAGLVHLRHFATHADWSGHGVGGLIYERCERDAHAAGISRVECYASLNAERFYASLGFVSEERIDIPLRRNYKFPCVRMQRSI